MKKTTVVKISELLKWYQGQDVRRGFISNEHIDHITKALNLASKGFQELRELRDIIVIYCSMEGLYSEIEEDNKGSFEANNACSAFTSVVDIYLQPMYFERGIG